MQRCSVLWLIFSLVFVGIQLLVDEDWWVWLSILLEDWAADRGLVLGLDVASRLRCGMGVMALGVAVLLRVVGQSGGCCEEGRGSLLSSIIKPLTMNVFFGGYVPDPYERTARSEPVCCGGAASLVACVGVRCCSFAQFVGCVFWEVAGRIGLVCEVVLAGVSKACAGWAVLALRLGW